MCPKSRSILIQVGYQERLEEHGIKINFIPIVKGLVQPGSNRITHSLNGFGSREVRRGRGIVLNMGPTAELNARGQLT